MAQSLDDLITSLATILIRYHDSQKINVCINLKENEPSVLKRAAREYATKLLQTENFDQEFQKLNVECTANYKERLELLTFIKNEIILLKELSRRSAPFNEEELEDYKSKIVVLLHDFKQLLNTPKLSTYSVHIKKLNEDSPVVKLGLHGMIDYKGVTNMFGMLKTSPLCNSGDLIREELLERLNLAENSTLHEIKIAAEHICEGHQHTLMAAALNRMEEKHSQELSSLTNQLNEKEKKLVQAQETINKYSVTIELQTNSLNKVQQELEAARLHVNELQIKFDKLSQSIQENSPPESMNKQTNTQESPYPILSYYGRGLRPPYSLFAATLFQGLSAPNPTRFSSEEDSSNQSYAPSMSAHNNENDI